MVTFVALVKGFSNRCVMIRALKAISKAFCCRLKLVTKVNNVFGGGSGDCFSEFCDCPDSHT